MLVGYEQDHASDCYQMWYPETNKVIVTRDVIWLRRMFFSYKKPNVKEMAITKVFNDGKGKQKDNLTVKLVDKKDNEDEKGQQDPIVVEVNDADDDDMSDLEGTKSAADQLKIQPSNQQQHQQKQKNQNKANVQEAKDNDSVPPLMPIPADDPIQVLQLDPEVADNVQIKPLPEIQQNNEEIEIVFETDHSDNDKQEGIVENADDKSYSEDNEPGRAMMV